MLYTPVLQFHNIALGVAHIYRSQRSDTFERVIRQFTHRMAAMSFDLLQHFLHIIYMKRNVSESRPVDRPPAVQALRVV